MLRVIERVKSAAYTKVYAIFACAITLAIAGIASIANTAPASADTTNINYNVSVASALTLTTTTNSMVLNLDPSTKTFDSKNITVGVGTNNKTGYTLTLSTPQDSTDLVRDNSEDGVSGTMPTLAAGTYTESTFTENKWGYKITSNTSIPSTVTTDYVPFTSGNTLMESDTAKNHDEASLTFAAKIDYLQASGSYSTTLNFHLVANPLATYMQDVDYTMCATTPMTVVDKRDNQEYTIRKLDDGLCWMTQNLRYIGDTGSTSGSMIMKADTSNIGADKTISYQDFVSSIGDYNYANLHVATPNQVPSGASYTATDMGVWYNYAATSAMSITGSSNSNTATQDICPKGWRLPTYDEQVNIITQVAAYAPITGGYYGGGVLADTSLGTWWASTAYDTNNHRRLNYRNSGLNNGYGPRVEGSYIRCVLKHQSMQSFTAADAANMAIGDTKLLSDARDGETYKVAKLKDGNIWMTQNLRLDPTAVDLNTLKGNTNATDEILTYFKNGGGSSPYTAYAVSNSWTSSSQNYYNRPMINASYKNTTQAASGNSPAGIIGVFYNYCAATAGSYCYASNAGSGNAQYDICPSGWKLPSGGTEKGSYYYLYTHATEGYNSNVAQFQSVLSTPLSGHFFSGSASSQGSTGYFWSSTYYNGNTMYYLYVDSSSVNPQYYGNRRGGYSVRCIFQ